MQSPEFTTGQAFHKHNENTLIRMSSSGHRLQKESKERAIKLMAYVKTQTK
jgi:hypothetical protein